VRRLEQELGIALLRRLPSGVELTAAGADLVARAEAIIAQIADARAAMDQHAGGLRGVARVAVTPGAEKDLAEALSAFHGLHPGIQVSLRQAAAIDVVALLGSGSVDVAVAALSQEARAAATGVVERVPLREEALQIITPPGHGLATTPERRAQDLRGEPLVLTEPGTALRETVLSICADEGFSPLPLLEVGDPGTLREIVHAGLGASVVPTSWLDRPGAAVDAVVLSHPRARHAVELLAPTGGASPAGRLLHGHLLARRREGL
jgi:DNA-binding transcriptional LysR family regulator